MDATINKQPPGGDAPIRSVLVTGATGYIGGRLVPALLERGYTVRVLARDSRRVAGRDWAGDVEVVEGDLEDPESTARALAGMDAAYYLVHSMQAGADFAGRDRRAAQNFIAGGQHLRHVVYLGGLVPKVEAGSSASAHLSSRSEVGKLLRDNLPTTELRAGPVIGSGSASFEMLRYLTERLPVMVAPRWVKNRIQCIGIRDMLAYLLEALDGSPVGVVDVGSDALNFREMMQQYASVRGLKRVIIPVPVLTPGLAAEWIQFVTPISRNMAVPIVKGMIYPLLADTAKARELYPQVKPESYRASVRRALSKLEAGDVETHWSGAQGRPPVRELTHWEGMARDVRSVYVSAAPEQVFAIVSTLGGRRGWLSDNWLWRLRGVLDKMVGGPGLRRGRRDPRELLRGETVDFWRVEEIRAPELLRLRAEMKLPGAAWLQWEIIREESGCRLVQSSLFAPAGTLGWLYWNALYPVHNKIFGRLLRAVAAKAQGQRAYASGSLTSSPKS